MEAGGGDRVEGGGSPNKLLGGRGAPSPYPPPPEPHDPQAPKKAAPARSRPEAARGFGGFRPPSRQVTGPCAGGVRARLPLLFLWLTSVVVFFGGRGGVLFCFVFGLLLWVGGLDLDIKFFWGELICFVVGSFLTSS